MACGLREWARDMHVLQPTTQLTASLQRLSRGPEITMKYAVEAAIAANASSSLGPLDPLSGMSVSGLHDAASTAANNTTGSPSSIASGPVGQGGGSGTGGQREERFSKTNIYLRGLRETDTDETLKEMVAHVVGADNIKSSRAIIDSREDTPAGANSGCRASDATDSSPRRKVARTRSPPKEGYGFIDFKSEEIAQQALEYLKTNEQLKAERPNLEVKFARDNEKDPTNIYLQGMPLSFRNDKDLEEIFKTRIGGVSSARVMIERRSNDPTGVAFVRFSTPGEAQRAIEAVNNGDITIEGVHLEAKLADRHNPDERRRRSRHGNSRSGTATQNGFALSNSFLNQAQYLNYITSNQLASYPATYYQAAASVGANRLGAYHLAAAPAASLSPAAAAPSSSSFGPAIAYSLSSPGILQQQLAAANSQNAAVAALTAGSASGAANHHPSAAYFAAAVPGNASAAAAAAAAAAALGSNSELSAASSYQNLLLQQQLQNNYAAVSSEHNAVAAAAAAAYAQAYAPFAVVQSPQEQHKM